MRALAGPWEGYDTTPADLARMEAALGPLARQLGLRLETRADVDRVVALPVGQVGL